MIDFDKKEILDRKEAIEQLIDELNNDYCFCLNHQFDDDNDYEETYYFVRRDHLVKVYDFWRQTGSDIISLSVEATKENIDKVYAVLDFVLENEEKLGEKTDRAIAEKLCEELDIGYTEVNYIDERYDKDIIFFRGKIYSPQEFLESEARCLRDGTEVNGVYFDDCTYNLKAFLDKYVVPNEIDLNDIEGFGWEGYGFEQRARDYVLLKQIEKGLI